MLLFHRIFLSILLFCSIKADIVYETGNLIDFFSGEAPDSDYDNWLSHVSEGIAENGYNDHGPPWIDIQTNDFGTYRHLEEDSPTLDYWRIIFSHFINHDTLAVDSLLLDSITIFNYELVIFEDTSQNRSYHILREKIDSAFVDLNQIEIPEDDIVGSFKNGWGLYIIQPEATKEQVIIQVPHPSDDFIAPYIAMDLYLELDAFAFMISGVSREKLWTEVGSYSNSKSLSDPSRYQNTVFQEFHETAVNPLLNVEKHSPIVFAIHSFDNETHLERNSVIIAAGSQNPKTNKPIRDISEDHFDIINFTQEFPIAENQFGNNPELHVTDYYEVYYDDEMVYANGNEDQEIIKATELRGPSNGIQMVHLQQYFHEASVYEPWIHIELDEKPALFDNEGISDDFLYNAGMYPTGYQNFSIIRDYYRPFITAVNNYLEHFATYEDLISPDSIEFLMAYNGGGQDLVDLLWEPIDDTNFKSYEIQYDQDSIQSDSPILDLAIYPSLQDMRLNNQIITGFDYNEDWLFRIRGIDYLNNAAPWSNIISNRLPGHSPSDTILFYNDSIILLSYSEEDFDSNSYYIDSLNTWPGNTPTLNLFGNTWKKVAISPFLPDTQTVFHLNAKIDSLSEIQAIGFSDGIRTIRYSLGGTETLNIENWIPVYQGTVAIGEWGSFELPIGDDWVAWYDTLSYINEIQFINDHDDIINAPGSIQFSMIRNITPNLYIKPEVSISYTLGDIRLENNEEMISISFNSSIIDTDSYYFSYSWEFGDGAISNLANPTHDFIIEDDHDYTVLLTVEDESGLQNWATATVQIDEGETSFPLKFNFVGDIMMGRRFEDDDGIITNQNVSALFEPTLDILGNIADVTIANLEIPLTNHDEQHPTKSVIFKSAPENVFGLIYGGIDVVSLANNHIMDYMEPGMIQTINILNEAGIYHSGAGMNSYEAYLPTFLSRKGQTIAVISSSDRTGQYNNYQPYLNAGENKAGFAYMTPYYIKEQIQSVQENADLIIVQMHAGSEYSYAPGSDYDSWEPPSYFENLRFNPSSEFGFIPDPFIILEEEDYSHRLDRPQMWDRAIRQFAINQGADIVIVHHPHIIQGVEIYNGKLIAHSLGNFIFDLNYPETFPSMILNADADESGFYSYSITPLYIDDYLTIPATGELANYILDYIATRSRELDTYLHVDINACRAHIITDSNSINNQSLVYTSQSTDTKQIEFNSQVYFKSNPIQLAKSGSIAQILGGYNYISHYRLGREKIWMKNFEYEGSSLWNINSDSESIQDSIFRRGGSAVYHTRNPESPGNIITNLEYKLPINNEFGHSLHGFIKTQNGKNVTLELKLAQARSGNDLITQSINDSIQGDQDWLYFWDEIVIPENAEFFDIRMNTDIPDSGQSKAWFDDVGLIEWDSLMQFSNFPIQIPYPNDYNYIQVFFSQNQVDPIEIELTNAIIGAPNPLRAIPRAVSTTITAPGNFHLYDESTGPVGNRQWSFGQNQSSKDWNPVFFCEEPGIYNISLTVIGLNNQEDIMDLTLVALEAGTQLNNLGDINGDNNISTIDVLLCINFILNLTNFSPQEFISADIDKNGTINIFDVLSITSLID